MAFAPTSERTYTYGDYRTWPEDQRWEIIEGRAYAMTGPRRIHQQVSGEIFRQIANHLLNAKCQVYAAPFDVRLPKSDEADDDIETVVQPDIVVVCDSTKLDDAGCRGAPDLIMEVLSPSTAGKDQVKKLELYEKHGVREYWIIDPTEQVALLRTLDDDESFSAPSTFALDAQPSGKVLGNFKLNLELVFRRN